MTPALRWVKDNEERARTKYVANRMEAGEVMTVSPTGLSLHPGMSYLGASADGYITCQGVDTNCCGCLEIKCPFSIDSKPVIDLTPREIAEKHKGTFFLGSL